MADESSRTSSPLRALSRLRRKPDGSNNSSSSVVDSSNSDDTGAEQSTRASIDGHISKIKDRVRRRSMDERSGRTESTSRLSKLVPLRRRKSRDASTDALPRRLSVGSGSPSLSLPNNYSGTSLPDEGSGGSSLLTDDDSDVEGKSIRPALSPHQSHAGYLTLSSPEITPQTTFVQPGTETSWTSTDPYKSPSTTNPPRIIEPAGANQSFEVEPCQPPLSPDRDSSPTGKPRNALPLHRKKIVPATESSLPKPTGQQELDKSIEQLGSSISVIGQGTTEDSAQTDGSTPSRLYKSQERLQQEGDLPVTPRSRGRPGVNTTPRPETPPSFADSPTTFVTPPTPTFPDAGASTFPRSAARGSSPSGPRGKTSIDSIRNRRPLSANLPSKLSHSIPAPLTPTIEEAKTPGGTLSHPALATGFFSSVFSAAQKAAGSLGNNLNSSNLAAQRYKSVTSVVLEQRNGEEVIPGSASRDLEEVEKDAGKQAITTLGSGDLKLGHLGIADTSGVSPMSSTSELTLQNGAMSAAKSTDDRAEEEAAARAVSEAYEKPVVAVASQAHGINRPVSVTSSDRLTSPLVDSPPRYNNSATDIKRSGSVRSRVSARRQRHRASSATTAGTANTIAAALSASATGMSNMGGNGAGHRLTGFAVASNKRNKDFHQLFRSVPEDDYLIEDYSAALQRDILLHGRLYISEGHICFSSNILGWVTNLVMSFDEVVSVEKKSTAMIFPNAIVIQTLNARNTFASFAARDSTYELLIGIWKISHPNLKSSINGVTLDNAGTGDRTEVAADAEESEDSEGTGSGDEVYDEDADDNAGSFEDDRLAPSVVGSEADDQTLSRKASAAAINAGATQANGTALKGLETADAVVTGAAVSSDFPGPPTHEPTQCADGAEHYDRPLTDTTIPAPLGKVFSLTYGPQSVAFMRKWLVEEQKSRELNLAEDKIGLDNEHKTMTFDYIKPLNAPVGPRQTKCITTNTLTSFDLEKAVTVDVSTQTPDVPSGSVFTTKTRYCLMWAPGNSTRMIATCTIEWTGKSWLKGPIEKGANDGQLEYVKSLVAALKAAVTTKPPVKGVARKGKRKGKKEVFDAEEANVQRDAIVAAQQQDSSWGALEPLHGLLKPVISILSPFITSQVVIAVLFVLLMSSWFQSTGRAGTSLGYPGYTSPERIAAYEEIWSREESSLWEWLDDRVGVNGIYSPSVDGDKQSAQRVLAARSMGKKLGDERMGERQMDDAIRTTEERLLALKDAVARKKTKRKA